MDGGELRAASLREWDRSASGWDGNAARVEEHARPVTMHMLAAADPRAGERILELACGAGALGLAAARRVGPTGHAVLSDFSPEMVEVARRRAERESLGNVELRVLDAESTGLADESVDVVACRFGLMLMTEPLSALGEMRRIVAPGGRVVVAVWGPASANPWASLPAFTLMERLGAPPPDPASPGMFALGDRNRLAEMFDRAGFRDATIAEVAGSQRHASFDAWWAETSELTPAFADLVSMLGDADGAGFLNLLRNRSAAFRRSDGALDFPSLALVGSALR